MKILFVSVEVAPFAKVGGLADVAGSLPLELSRMGHDVRIVMPLYRMIEDDSRWHLHTALESFDVRMSSDWTKQATFRETEFEGVPVGFIGTDEWYDASVSSDTVYEPGCMQHLFFSTAVIRAMEELDWVPDVIHANDWHTGFLPVVMREKFSRWRSVGTVFTIHNLAYQGEFGLEVLDALDLPHSLFTPERLETWGRVNFLKAGMVYADQVTTVSRTYAEQIQTPEYGCTLEGLTQHLALQGRLSGIVNGIDTERFNPASDGDIPAHFSATDLTGKALCRAALLKEIGLAPIEGAPLVGVVSRVSSQKGMDLMLEAAEAMFALPIQLVVQGIGEPWLADGFKALEKRFPSHFRYLDRFDAPLAQRVYAGCDAFLMPSAFEPCGLGQLIAMRYGTIPVVRETGGLKDTVTEGENGFSFVPRTAVSMLAAVTRMHRAHAQPDTWQRLIQNAMAGDIGWHESAARYLEVYERARDARRVDPVLAS